MQLDKAQQEASERRRFEAGPSAPVPDPAGLDGEAQEGVVEHVASVTLTILMRL